MTGLSGMIVLVHVVVDDVRGKNDVTGGDEEDSLAITAFGHIEAPSPFSPRCGLGTDAETESGGKRPTDLRSRVEIDWVGRRIEEPGTDRSGDDGLP